MAGYADTPLTGAHFAAFCEKMVGQPYWYGACCYKATQSLLSSKSKQYPGYYTAGRMDQCQRDIAARAVVADCIGGAKGYAWTNGGASILAAIGTDAPILSKYGANGCPDKGANGMFTYAKSKGCPWGPIATLPETLGLALGKDGHVGYYIGNGELVEWRGFNYGCVRTRVSQRDFQYWYQLPFLRYEGGNMPAPDPEPTPDPDPQPGDGTRAAVRGQRRGHQHPPGQRAELWPPAPGAFGHLSALCGHGRQWLDRRGNRQRGGLGVGRVCTGGVTK